MDRLKPKVSICCITYNQEKFIRETLDSLLSQECNFDYEIIIHDDCSTDGTIEILKDYQKRHPQIIKLLLEDKNQYTLGKKIFLLTFNESSGEYIALCEGDDYWIDKFKLQKQIEYMDNHPDCSFTFHNAYRYDEQTKTKQEFIPATIFSSHFLKKDRHYNVGELELLGFIPTASFVTRTECLKDIPAWYYNAPVEDLPIKLYCAMKGNTYYFDEVMSVYRVNSGNSVMDEWSRYKIDQRVKLEEKLLSIINEVDKDTGCKYHDWLKMARDLREVNIYFLTNDYLRLRNKNYNDVINKMGIKIKLQIYLLKFFPHFCIFLKSIKYKLIRKSKDN